jgi:hypothetical protein
MPRFAAHLTATTVLSATFWLRLAEFIQDDMEESPEGEYVEEEVAGSGATVSPETPEALGQGADYSRRSARASARKPRAVRAPMSASPTIPSPGPDLGSPPGTGRRGKRSHAQASTAAPRNTRPRLSYGASLFCTQIS